MPKYNKHIHILKRIISYCAEIDKTMAHFGETYEKFRADSIYQNACSMCLMQIGELTARCDEEFRKQYDEIPWRLIKGMRNMLVHEYEKISYEEFWNTLIEDIPKLRDACERILASQMEPL